MNQEPLVSVITPCYNGESYMRPMLDSLLAQTYKNVEFFFVNDGSTDRTEEIFFEYKPKLEAKDWKVIYHKQKNGGAARAVNFGLARFTGNYLTWPDSDDILYPDYLASKVLYMKTHPTCALLFNPVDSCLEHALEKKLKPLEFTLPKYDETFFDKLLFQKGVQFCPISSFARTSDFLQALPGRHIYDESKGGQNWQMLLPLAYTGKVDYLDKILACYVERSTSHSHTSATAEMIRQAQYEDVLTHALLSITAMPEKEKQTYLGIIKKLYVKKRLKIRIKQILLSMLGEPFFNKLKGFFK